MKKKTMMIIGFTLLMSQFMYGDPNMDRLLNEARKRQAAEKAEIDKQERESSKEVSNKIEKQEKVKKEKHNQMVFLKEVDTTTLRLHLHKTIYDFRS